MSIDRSVLTGQAVTQATMHSSVQNRGPAALPQSHQYYRSSSLIISEPLRRILLTQKAGSSLASASSSPPSSIPNSNHVNDPEQTRPNSPVYMSNSSGFDINIVIITAAILFLLLSALAMNCIVKCMLRRCSFMFSCYGAFPSASNQESGHNNHHNHEAGMKKKEIKALPSIVYRDGARNSNSNTNHHHHRHHHHHHYPHSHDNHGCHDPHHDQHKNTRGYGREEDGSCPICLGDFKDGDRVRVLPPCCHRFHMSCIDTWLVKHSSCPTCRGQLMGPMEVERPHVQLHILITTPTTTPSLADPQVSHKDGSVSS